MTEQDFGKDAFAHLGIDSKFKVEGDTAKAMMTQDGLPEKICEQTRWGESSGTRALVTERPLGAEREGEPFPLDSKWECTGAGMTGSLMFLVNARAETQLVAHQCVWFTRNPKQKHCNTAKHATRHLKGAKVMNEDGAGEDRGLTFDTGNACDVPRTEAVRDSDFAGSWNIENNDDDLVSSDSREGFTVFVRSYPAV